jgi:hypothetical protein
VAANSVNREVVRDKLAALLTPVMVGVGKPVQALFNYRPGDFGKQSPVMMVSGEKVARAYVTLSNAYDTAFSLAVHVFIAYADKKSGWTEAQAEDRLDVIEKMMADVVMDNRNLAGFWDLLGFAGQSEEDDVVIGGEDYRRAKYVIIGRAIHG